MTTSRHQLLDSQFLLHSASGEARFFERMAQACASSEFVDSTAPTVDIHVHRSSASELVDAVTDWQQWGHFHRSLNYSHWNLEGP